MHDHGGHRHRGASTPGRPAGVPVLPLDGSPVDSALSGQLAGSPTSCRTRSRTSPGASLADVSPRSPTRSSAGRKSTSDDQAPIYIFIYDLQRFRDLRKSDDDFGFSRYGEDKPAPPVEALRRHPPRRPAGRHPHDHLVRQRQQPEPDLRPPGHEGVRESASCSR